MDIKKNRKIENFLKKIEKKFHPQKIILFGSRAREDHLENSDYDLLIIAELFKNMSFRERIIELYKLIDEPLNVEVIALTPGEFEKRRDELTIIGEAAREGKIIA